jgi:hypothetical protein
MELTISAVANALQSIDERNQKVDLGGIEIPPGLEYPRVKACKNKRIKKGRIIPSPTESSAWGVCTVPNGMRWVGRKAKAMWYQLVAALITKNGEVTLSQKFILNSIIRAEIHCQMAERIRRDRWNAGLISLEQFDVISRGIVRISKERDKMVLALGIDSNTMDIFSRAMQDDDPVDAKDAVSPDVDEPLRTIETIVQSVGDE